MIIDIKQGNLLEEFENYNLDGIMNAANGIGPMGAGIAGAIRRYDGMKIQNEAYSVCRKYNPNLGEAYFTGAGILENKGIKNIIHAVTVNYPALKYLGLKEQKIQLGLPEGYGS